MFNVDGLATGTPSPTGIGGILCNEDGVVVMVFSKSVRTVDSNEVEFLAIKEAFLAFAASKWGKSYGLIIESDSVNAIKWINLLCCTPWKLRKHNSFVELMKTELMDWKVQHIYKKANEFQDSLAKARVNRLSSLLVVLKFSGYCTGSIILCTSYPKL
ncbi:hypothetical protein REPUB_Repub03eG0132000 [Reevesia pubescens]